MVENLLELGLMKVEENRKIIYAGQSKVLPVYRIPLDLLYYNDRNDRIATWISQYKHENNIDQMDVTAEGYNAVIHKFIVESNPDAINTTKASIQMRGQDKAGVVMMDGRIIDGNRRFTCLRELAKTDPQFGYFNAAILGPEYMNSDKEIKKLELAIQFGEEDRVGYDPIDRLAGMYMTITRDQTMSLEEYCAVAAMKISEGKKKLALADLMIEFLQFIDADEQFYIARDLNLDGPLNELLAALGKCKTDDDKERVKNAAFANFVMGADKDLTRFIRRFKSIIPSGHLDEFLDEQEELAEKVLDKLPDPEESKVTAETIRTMRADTELRNEMKSSVDTAFDRANLDSAKNMPAALVDKAKRAIEEVDTDLVATFFTQDQKEVVDKLQELRKQVDDLLEVLKNV